MKMIRTVIQLIHPLKIILEPSEDTKFSKNSLLEFRTPSAETAFITEISLTKELEEATVVALGKGKKYFQS